MASKAFSGVGTKFYKWDDSDWVAIAEITSIKGPGFKKEIIEVTSMDSTGGYKEFIAGFKEAGTISLTMNFTSDGYDALKADFEAYENQYYQVVLGNAMHTSFEFEGFVTELPLTIDAKNAVTLDVTIQVTGEVLKHTGEDSGSPSSNF